MMYNHKLPISHALSCIDYFILLFFSFLFYVEMQIILSEKYYIFVMMHLSICVCVWCIKIVDLLVNMEVNFSLYITCWVQETSQLEYIIPESSLLEHRLQVTDDGFIDFVRNLLEINPKRRPTADEALEHPWLSHSY